MLVWVASYPRSGNHLTMQALKDVYGVNRFGTAHGGGSQHWLTALNDGYEIPAELEGLDKADWLRALRERPEPFFVKSHNREDAASSDPALNVVRDGRDVHVSQAHWRIEKYPEIPFQEALDDLVGRRIWSRHVHDWRTRTAPTAILRFEDLLEDPRAIVGRACDELGVPLPEPSGEMVPFSVMRERNPHVYRKGRPGSWREEMPPRTQRRFWRVHGEEMEALGYTKERVAA